MGGAAAVEGPGAQGSSDFGDVDDGLVDVCEEFFVGGADEYVCVMDGVSVVFDGFWGMGVRMGEWREALYLR